MAIPRKREQRPRRCGPAEGVSATASRDRSKSNFLSAQRLSAEVVKRYQQRTAPLIERGIHTLGPEGVVRLIEENVGGDLQYIRVNGIVVGGLAGGALLRDPPPTPPALSDQGAPEG